MRKTMFWSNPTASGLCDRLSDVMLLATLANLLGADLYFNWIEAVFQYGAVGEPVWNYKEGQDKTWDKVRFEDYRYENYSQYFNLPKNIKINEVVNNPTYHFDSYLGGIFSPELFYEQCNISSICTFDKFLEEFKETVKQFTPTDKLLNLVSHLPKPNISVHLRRTDKIRVNCDNMTTINTDELDNLNKKTIEAIDILNGDDKLIYFASDDQEENKKYYKLYPNNIKDDVGGFEKTYIDLYMLMCSDYIIMSQIHSNFSVFASYINQAKLVYLYDNCLIIQKKFNKLDNFIYYKNLKEYVK